MPKRQALLARAVALLLLGAVLGTACTASGGSGGSATRSTTDTSTRSGPSNGSGRSDGSIDASLTRRGVACRGQDALGGDDVDHFVTAAYVVNGVLGATCFGDRDPSLISAWRHLVAVAPPTELRNLALFAGYTSTDETDLAYVNSIDDAGRQFQMSVNLDAYDEDHVEGELTMAHEFSHVFTALPDQLDRSITTADDCGTWYDGEGCFRSGSLMAKWIDAFWPAEELDRIDVNHDPEISDGDRLCHLNPGFLGSYAATNPEEDFAETFAAFVYRVDAPTAEVQDKFDWMARRPELAAFRHRATAAGLGPLEGDFDTCGS